eukprot:g3214.t1
MVPRPSSWRLAMKWAALATLHASMGCSFMSWTGPKPRPLVARRVAENMNMDTNVAAEVQAILDELRLDEWAEPQRMVESGAEAKDIPFARLRPC